jgi:HD-GYP domain-containing protein (c-di-GMP phosphodiesterase class II)
MLRVGLNSARPGMELALPVFHPLRHDTVLLEAGVVLNDHAVTRLRELDLRHVWIRYPGTEFIAECLSPAIMAAQAHLARHIADAFALVLRGADAYLDYGAYRRAMGGLLHRLIDNPRAAIFIQEMSERSAPALRHAGTVCYLSLLMGLKLDEYLITQRSRLSSARARDVTSLGVGAMLHDIGMLRLPPDVVGRWEKTRDESDPAWREHVHIGHRMIHGHVEAAASAAVLHHHQKFDGSGFPRRGMLDGASEALAGQDIHVFARIIAAADLFDRLKAAGEESEEAAPTVRVLRWMKGRAYKAWIDPVVYRALLAVVPPYAPGTLVRLNTGVQGVVVSWTPSDPCRPTVQRLDDPGRDWRETREERFVLRERPNLYVAEAQGVDVSRDNFYPTMPGEFDLGAAGRASLDSAGAF